MSKNQQRGQLLDETDPRPTDKHQRSKSQQAESYLNTVYEFRFNTIKQKPEYKLKGGVKNPEFKPIDKYKLLSIKRELDAHGILISKDGVMDILFSSFSKPVNPVKDYFKQNFPWDGITDHIKQLCDTVHCKNPDDWYTYLKKWLVAVIANVFIDERCANHTMLVLTGEQGKFKTTWLENLCPKKIQSYLFTGKMNLENKDSLTLIAEYLFVNIDDQLKQLHKKDENELKNLITINHVKYRRPYDPIITEYPHLCSFMASVNGNEFLNDPTGSRRFLPFEVLNIDIKAAQALDMDLVYAQAFHLWENGFVYWFNEAEIDKLNARNSAFSMISNEEELINYYFSTKKPTGSYAQKKFLPSAIIQSRIEKFSNIRMSSKKLGEALKKLGYNKTQKVLEGKITWGWEVYEKDHEQIETETLINEQQTVEI